MITVIIPDYEIVLNDTPVYYYDSVYPFLNYKGITYFPATFEYCKSMNLACGFKDGESFMIAYNPSFEAVPVYETTSNTKENIAVIPGYNIIINGRKTNNSKLEYPIFNFRGVTYFPMTWEFAVEEFGWQMDFSEKRFAITTDTSRDDLGQLVEVRDDDVIFREYGYFEMPQPDGSVLNVPGLIYYSVSFETGEIVRRDDYTQDCEPKNKKLVYDEKIEVSVKDGYVYFGEQQLEGVFINEVSPDFVKPDDVEKVEYSATMYKSGLEPLTVCKLNIYVANRRSDGSAYGTDGDYTYLLHNGKMIFIGSCLTISNPYVLGDCVYFNTNKYWKTFSSHPMQNKQLIRLLPDGRVEQVKYTDYNNMEIIGMANGLLYLKCTWSPTDSTEGSEVVTSLVADGYFTFDGTELKRVADYVYSTFDAVSKDGKILAINKRLGKVIKVK